MEKKIKKYYILSFISIILMGASLGSSIACFIIFLSMSSGTTIGGRLIFLNIMSYVLLLSFIILFILFILTIIKIRTLRMENHIQEGGNSNEKE